jgi:anthranilate phosphoribosyltransferase
MIDKSDNNSFDQDAKTVSRDMRQFLQQIATGPALSKDLNATDARLGMEYILDGRADEVQAAIFLIALRMKRETIEELHGVLQALLARTKTIEVDVPDLIDIADPFDGYVRGVPIAPFLPPLLAACGVPTISNGVSSMGPKYGITAHRVLGAAGCPVGLTLESAANQIADNDIGWSYIDQSQSCPALYRLLELRTRIVKRPCLTTLEVLLGPMRAKRTHLMTGYVHKPYPPIYTELARLAGYSSAMVVRGIEGGVIPSLNQASKYFSYQDGMPDEEIRLDPKMAGVISVTRTVSWPMDKERLESHDGLVNYCVEQGLGALGGEGGPFREGLLYSASLCLLHLGRAPDWATARVYAKKALDSGEGLARFQRATQQ